MKAKAVETYSRESWWNLVDVLDRLAAGTLTPDSEPLTGEAAAQCRRLQEETARELESLESLQGWYEIARTVNGGTAPDANARKVSVHLTYWLNRLHERGFPLSVLDREMGSAIGTAAMRLRRHGYKERYASQPAYKGVKTSNRPRGAPPDIAGQHFYRLTAARWTGERSTLGPMWVFRCDCGEERIAAVPQARAGKVKQCRTCGRTAQSNAHQI